MNLFTKKRFPNLSGTSLEHGGFTRPRRRKIARPVNPKKAMHLVLKSSRARGKWSLLTKENRKKVDYVLDKASRLFNVQVINRANVGSHIHLIVKAKSREGFQNFLRVASGHIAQYVTGARKARKKVGKFWDTLTYSRMLAAGEDYINTQIYITKNQLKDTGVELMVSTGFKLFKPRP